LSKRILLFVFAQSKIPEVPKSNRCTGCGVQLSSALLFVKRKGRLLAMVLNLFPLTSIPGGLTIAARKSS
jgi:hypothetical protein